MTSFALWIASRMLRWVMRLLEGVHVEMLDVRVPGKVCLVGVRLRVSVTGGRCRRPPLCWRDGILKLKYPVQNCAREGKEHSKIKVIFFFHTVKSHSSLCPLGLPITRTKIVHERIRVSSKSLPRRNFEHAYSVAMARLIGTSVGAGWGGGWGGTAAYGKVTRLISQRFHGVLNPNITNTKRFSSFLEKFQSRLWWTSTVQYLVAERAAHLS